MCYRRAPLFIVVCGVGPTIYVRGNVLGMISHDTCNHVLCGKHNLSKTYQTNGLHLCVKLHSHFGIPVGAWKEASLHAQSTANVKVFCLFCAYMHKFLIMFGS